MKYDRVGLSAEEKDFIESRLSPKELIAIGFVNRRHIAKTTRKVGEDIYNDLSRDCRGEKLCRMLKSEAKNLARYAAEQTGDSYETHLQYAVEGMRKAAIKASDWEAVRYFDGALRHLKSS